MGWEFGMGIWDGNSVIFFLLSHVDLALSPVQHDISCNTYSFAASRLAQYLTHPYLDLLFRSFSFSSVSYTSLLGLTLSQLLV